MFCLIKLLLILISISAGKRFSVVERSEVWLHLKAVVLASKREPQTDLSRMLTSPLSLSRCPQYSP